MYSSGRAAGKAAWRAVGKVACNAACIAARSVDAKLLVENIIYYGLCNSNMVDIAGRFRAASMGLKY
jgi:hypothetical protein